MARYTNSNPTMISRSIMVIASALDRARQQLFDAYRPELHYMRGPGPKWHEKHGTAAPEGDRYN